MYNILLVVFLSLFLTGCNFLPRISFDRPGNTPTSTEKSTLKESCKGEYKVDVEGNMTYCSKGYTHNAQNYKQADRKYTLGEKIGNFFRNLTGWGLPLVILACVFVPGFGGALLGFIFNNLFGVASRGFKALVTGIQKGKQYVRENGVKYSEAERVIYNKGADDMLAKISESITDPQIKKEIAVLRSQL